jgi:phenylacetate-CoA ligase
MRLKRLFHGVHSKLGPAGKKAMEYLYSVVPLRLRKKKGFWAYLQFLRESQWNSTDWHREFQNQQLRELLKFAASSTPYYRSLFKLTGVRWNEITSTEIIGELPILNKDTLVSHLKEFLPDNFPKSRLITNSTSGSTGEPFKFHLDYYAAMREEAFAVRHWENSGMRIGERSIYLRSYIPERGSETYYFDRVNNRHFFSAYHLEKKNLNVYCQRLHEIKARFIFGYPSSLEILAEYLIEAGRSFKFQAAITGSEMLSTNARLKIEKAFETRVYDWYGLAEPTVTIGQCDKGQYHVFSEYGFAELVDAKGNPVRQEGEIGRILGTNFSNRALPLIRYDTKDLGVYTSKKCACGRGTPVIVSSIYGRKDDLLIGADGQYLPSVNFYSLFAKMGGEVNRFQLIQNESSRFTLKLIKGPEFGESSINRIMEGLVRRIGGRPVIKIITVDKIEPTKAGKIRAVAREYMLQSAKELVLDEN